MRDRRPPFPHAPCFRPVIVAGTYLLACDGADCCYEGGRPGDPAGPKKFDIFHSSGHWNPIHPKVAYLGKGGTTELNGVAVPNADVWNELDHLPFTNGTAVNYTYFITLSDDRTDTISHRIDMVAPGHDGSILYGDFQVQHDIDAFREAIKQYAPAICLHPNVLQCPPSKSRKWNSKPPPSFGYVGRL